MISFPWFQLVTTYVQLGIPKIDQHLFWRPCGSTTSHLFACWFTNSKYQLFVASYRFISPFRVPNPSVSLITFSDQTWAIWYPIILSVFPNFTHWSGFPWVQHRRGGGWVPAEGNFRGSPAGLEPWLDHYLRASNHLGLKPWNMWDFSGGFTWLKMTKHIANIIYILNEFWALIGLWIAKPTWQVYPHNQWTIEVLLHRQ